MDIEKLRNEEQGNAASAIQFIKDFINSVDKKSHLDTLTVFTMEKVLLQISHDVIAKIDGSKDGISSLELYEVMQRALINVSETMEKAKIVAFEMIKKNSN